MKNKKIGLFGYGCVGQGLHDILLSKPQYKSDIDTIVVKQKNKKRRHPEAYFNFEKNDILRNDQIDLVVELIDDSEEAFLIVKEALSSGKNVVSANKKMIAEHFEELVNLQKSFDTSLLYEASVCGAIPIIRTLEEYFDNEPLNSLDGIFNGSSNFILSKVIDEGLDYSSALKEAQRLGFAESDPTLDVGGFDSKYKLVIAAGHAYGVFINPDEVLNIGINNLGLQDIEYAQQNDLSIKLVAQSRKLNNTSIAAFVAPMFVPKSHPLSNVHNEYNAVVINGQFSEQQLFIGKGAGGHPTGSAVLSDVSANSYDYSYEYKKYNQKEKHFFNNNVEVKVYLRFDENLLSKPLTFMSIINRSENYVIGTLSLNELINRKSDLEKIGAFVAVIGNPQEIHTNFKLKNKHLQQVV